MRPFKELVFRWSPLIWVTLFYWWPAVAAATTFQTAATEVVINFVEEVEGDQALTLNVYFTLVETGTGQVATRADVDSATISLNADGRVYPVQVERPTTPIYLALVLDASGSMRDAVAAMRQAAIEAIGEAPPAAYFMVLKFNETTTPLLPTFTADHDQVIAAINSLEVDDSGTCLYDATYAAIDLLQQVTQNVGPARRAVILFTDGRDERTAGHGDTCSQHTSDQVIQYAIAPNTRTPLYTIGMSGSPYGIDSAELSRIAKETGGLSDVDTQAGLSDVFRRTMEALKSQWLAWAQVYPRPGPQLATLSVIQRDNPLPIGESFTFTAGRDYAPPLQPVEANPGSFSFDQTQGVYVLSPLLGATEQIGQLEVSTWDTENGVQVGAPVILANPGPRPSILIPTTGLTAGREYTLRLSAFTADGEPLKNERGETVLLEHTFRYDPGENSEPTLAIASVTLAADSTELTLALQTENSNRITGYEGWLVDQNTNNRVYTLATNVTAANTLTASLAGLNTGQYTIILVGRGADSQPLVETRYPDWVYVSPEPPSIIERIGAALAETPIIIVFIILILLVAVAVVVWLWARAQQTSGIKVLSERLRPRRQTAPPIHHTRLYGAAPAAPSYRPTLVLAPTLQITVDRSPDPEMVGARQTVTSTPFTIGRGSCHLNVNQDPRVSRQHATIIREGHTFLIRDDGSTHGTFVNDEPLLPQQPFPIPTAGAVHIRLGPLTHLTLRMVTDDF
ncbi:MAG: FHA domain-containing protein [Chloroflexota bacterium]